MGGEVQRRGFDSLIDRTPPGRTPNLNGKQLAELAAAVESGPILTVHGVLRWGIVESLPIGAPGVRCFAFRGTMSCALCAMNYRMLTARAYHHAQAEGAIEEFKNFPKRLEEIARQQGVKTRDRGLVRRQQPAYEARSIASCRRPGRSQVERFGNTRSRQRANSRSGKSGGCKRDGLETPPGRR